MRFRYQRNLFLVELWFVLNEKRLNPGILGMLTHVMHFSMPRKIRYSISDFTLLPELR